MDFLIKTLDRVIEVFKREEDKVNLASGPSPFVEFLEILFVIILVYIALNFI